jgi:hypothetical protein
MATSVKSKLAKARQVIRHVNEHEPNAEGQVKFSRTGEIKVAALSNRRTKQSNPRLAWVMFHRICTMMYRESNKKTIAYFD